ncbi:hypothetical protein NECID01_1242 [Nematocida sp. AWRm77]|nr:hypothetical protein NECID01_1242 [Nematocida sp. AWRm77]
MNIGNAMQALEGFKFNKESKKERELPFTYTDFFAEKKTVFENLGLSWRQRVGCIAVCGVLAFFFFFRALTNIIYFFYKPEKFGQNYMLFCMFSVVMMGFFSGFKTFAKNITSKDMLPYSTVFFINSFVVMVYHEWMAIIRLPVTILEIIAFSLFTYAYLTRKFSMGVKGLATFSLF